MSRHYRIPLQERQIRRLITQLQKYKDSLPGKCQRIRERIASEIQSGAYEGFMSAMFTMVTEKDHVTITVPPENIDVYVESPSEKLTVVIANGQDAAFIEFGTGVFFNGPAGTSPHPKGAELNATIGSYGKGHGKRPKWYFYYDGQKVYTRGFAAVRPMYNAMQVAIFSIAEIAREVFAE